MPVELLCIGKDGQSRKFFGMVKRSQREIWVLAYSQRTPDPSDEFYEFGAILLDNEMWQVVMQDHHNDQRYMKMGLPESLILWLKDDRQSVVRSSSLIPAQDDFVTDNARKVWERLVDRDQATKGKEFYFTS